MQHEENTLYELIALLIDPMTIKATVASGIYVLVSKKMEAILLLNVFDYFSDM